MTQQGDIQTSREMIRQLTTQLEKHSQESSAFRNQVIQSLAEIKTDSKHVMKSIDSHEEKIGKLESAHNRQKGAMWAIGLSGGAAFFNAIKQWLS